jgi:hypothetical protein
LKVEEEGYYKIALLYRCHFCNCPIHHWTNINFIGIYHFTTQVVFGYYLSLELVLYNAVSATKNIHATNQKAVIVDAGGIILTIIPAYKVETTKENLHDDIDGEAYEAKTRYPNFLKQRKQQTIRLLF